MSQLTTTPLRAAPSASASLNLVTPASAWTPGAWVQFIAATGAAAQIAGVLLGSATRSFANAQVLIEIGVGGVGAEVVIGALRLWMPNSSVGGDGIAWFPAPIDNVPSGSRVSLRMTSGAGSAFTNGFALLYYEGLSSTNKTMAALIDAPYHATMVSVAVNTTAWANSAWVQLIASVANESALTGLAFRINALLVQYEFDLAVGAAGSETVITTLRGDAPGGNAGWIQGIDLPAPLPVPAGTRIAVRARKSGTDADPILVALRYYGAVALLGPLSETQDLEVDTRPATSIQSNRATLNGRINPAGFAATGRFLWSTDPDALTNETLLRSMGEGSAFVSYGRTITGLTPETTYYFRAIGYGVTDTVMGSILSFSTAGEHVFVDGEVSHPLTWERFTDRDDVPHVYAEVDLNDPPTYYDGYKAPLVLKWSPITRGLSDRTGQVQHMAFGSTKSDVPREFRGYLDDATKRYMTNRPLEQYMIDDEARRALGLPRLVANGYLADYSPTPNLQFQMTGCDWLQKKFSRKAKAQRAWQPSITLDDFPHASDELFSDSGAKISPNAVGKAAPLWYGKVSDKTLVSREVVTPGTGGRLVLDPTLPDAGIEVPANANGIYGWSTFDAGQNIRFALTVVDTGTNEEGPFSRIIGTMTMTYPASAYPALSFEQASVPGRTIKYRVYMFDGYFNPNTGESIGNTFVRYKEHDDSTVDGFFGHKFGVGFSGPADGSDWFTSSSPSTTMEDFDTGKGAIAPIWVGPYTLGGRYLQGALIARGASKLIEAGYLNGQPVDLANDPDWVTPVNAAAWLAAGFTEPYVEINSTRYTMAFLGGVAGNTLAGITPPVTDEIGIAFNLHGIEDIGDGSGDLITSLPQQAKHFCRNFMAPDTPPGQDWLTECPTFPHLPDLHMVDEDSFDAVEAEWENILYGGAEGGFGIGANGDLVNALDVLASFNRNGDWESFFTRKGQYALTIQPVQVPISPARVDDVISIVADSFSIRDQVSSEFFNVFPYVHTEDYTGRSKVGWYSKVLGELEVRDATSVANYDQERESPVVELNMLRSNSTQGSDTIAAVMARKLSRYRHPLRTAAFTVPLSGTGIEAGDVFQLTAVEGIGASGWQNRLVRATEHELDPNLNRVQLRVYDVEPLLAEVT